ncbi:Gfo/Idh/MocA family protein, partial [Mediterraneibacter faecis]
MAAHNQRFTLAHRKAKEILMGGQLGKVIAFRCTLAHDGPERFSINRSTSTWYLNKRNSGFGCITDLG